MKAFQKLALVSAIAAAPFAQAELTSIDDSVLSDMTGQAGISIELSAEVSIGGIEYTDTDGLDGALVNAGKLSLNTIVLGGNGGSQVTGALDGIKIDIDVDDAGGLLIHLGATNEYGVASGTAPVDFGLSVGDVLINDKATLASNIYIGGNLGPVDVVIDNDGLISVDAYFEVTDGGLNIDVMGVGVSNLKIGQDSSPFVRNYEVAANTTYLQAATADANTATAAAASTDTYALAQTATVAADWITANAADPANPTAQETTDSQTAETNAYNTVYAAAYDGIFDATVDGAVSNFADANMPGMKNMAYVAMEIATASTSYTDSTNTAHAVNNALEVKISAMSMDISMDLTAGTDAAGDGLELGSIAINDLDLSNTSLIIYGH